MGREKELLVLQRDPDPQSQLISKTKYFYIFVDEIKLTQKYKRGKMQ
jgi:hypothetical protein